MTMTCDSAAQPKTIVAKSQRVPHRTPVHRQNASELNFAPTPATIRRMLELLIVIVRALTLALRGHRELVLENLALRQQLAAFHRTTRCHLRATRPTLLDGPREKLAKLAQGVVGRSTGHRSALASRLASTPLDPPLTAATSWPSAN